MFVFAHAFGNFPIFVIEWNCALLSTTQTKANAVPTVENGDPQSQKTNVSLVSRERSKSATPRMAQKLRQKSAKMEERSPKGIIPLLPIPSFIQIRMTIGLIGNIRERVFLILRSLISIIGTVIILMMCPSLKFSEVLL